MLFLLGQREPLNTRLKEQGKEERYFFWFGGGGLDFINLFLEKGEGREKEREGIIDV